MATAKEARDWAHATLRGLGNSLYTPFCGDDGDDIDWGAYQTLVRYCVGGLHQPMLWCTSGFRFVYCSTVGTVAIADGVGCRRPSGSGDAPVTEDTPFNWDGKASASRQNGSNSGSAGERQPRVPLTGPGLISATSTPLFSRYSSSRWTPSTSDRLMRGVENTRFS
jgi:hypothetical protein